MEVQTCLGQRAMGRASPWYAPPVAVLSGFANTVILKIHRLSRKRPLAALLTPLARTYTYSQSDRASFGAITLPEIEE